HHVSFPVKRTVPKATAGGVDVGPERRQAVTRKKPLRQSSVPAVGARTRSGQVAERAMWTVCVCGAAPACAIAGLRGDESPRESRRGGDVSQAAGAWA